MKRGPALAALVLTGAGSALHGAEPLLVEAEALDRLGALGITLAANGALIDPGARPAVAAGAWTTGDRLVIVGGGAPRRLLSVSFDAAAALGTSALNTRVTPAGTAYTVTPGDSGSGILPAGSAAAALVSAGRWTAITPDPGATLGVAPSDLDGDLAPDTGDAFPTDPAASVDTDGDGAPDAWNLGRNASDSTTGLVLDAFPTDPAASVDTDGDGYPDAWNPGSGPEDSTTGLVLDAFPDDPGRWSAATVVPALPIPWLLLAGAALLGIAAGLRGAPRIRPPRS